METSRGDVQKAHGGRRTPTRGSMASDHAFQGPGASGPARAAACECDQADDSQRDRGGRATWRRCVPQNLRPGRVAAKGEGAPLSVELPRTTRASAESAYLSFELVRGNGHCLAGRPDA